MGGVSLTVYDLALSSNKIDDLEPMPELRFIRILGQSGIKNKYRPRQESKRAYVFNLEDSSCRHPRG